MPVKSIYHTIQRYRTLRSDVIRALPIAILMPHSACNCRCAMCDIWKDNHHLKQLTEKDILGLLQSFKQFGTQQVLLSGGEALLHPNFFRFCEILQSRNIRISLLSTGVTLKKHAEQLTKWVSDIIVSLDGPEPVHDRIRNIPGAFQKMKEGMRAIRDRDPLFPITGRSVLHRMNFRDWQETIEAAKDLELDQISFLPADLSSQAFNRIIPWDQDRQGEIGLSKEELPFLESILEEVLVNHAKDIASHFIAEDEKKLRDILRYYQACHGLQSFPYKKCNAPWVSTVIEPDGTVRPCFFHDPLGNIRDNNLEEILNGEAGILFRKNLDMNMDPTCKKCVCSLYLAPTINLNPNRKH